MYSFLFQFLTSHRFKTFLELTDQCKRILTQAILNIRILKSSIFLKIGNLKINSENKKKYKLIVDAFKLHPLGQRRLQKRQPPNPKLKNSMESFSVG